MSTSLDLCQRLFPYVMRLEDGGKITFVSDKLANRLSVNPLGSTLAEAFEILSPPPNSKDCSTIDKSHIGKLFLMHTPSKDFAVRGQIVDGFHNNHETLFFVGAPWSSWMYENNRGAVLDAEDFPIQDSQLDQQMYLTTQNIMRSDLEELGGELKAAQLRAEAASQAKTEFVKHISHEIRTPLNGITTSLSLLSDPAQKMRHPRLLAIAKSSAQTLMELVDDVLDFSRIEEGLTTNAKIEFDLRIFAEELEAAFSMRASERKIRLSFILASNLPQLVCADKKSLQKICYNLISNAIKYSKTRLLELDFSIEFTDASQPHQALLVFKCIDYGIGIPPENQASVFEPFWTSLEVKQSNEQSTGLGLTITRDLTALLGGELSLESELGSGATFIAKIPIDIIAKSKSTGSDTSTTRSSSADTRKQFAGSALLVDDNSINLELGQILLQQHGLEIDLARDGQQAVDAAKAKDYDIIFMDIGMPVMGGIEATQAIHALPSREKTTIIALTANASRDDIASYIEAGMLDTLIKPIEPLALEALCCAYLEPKSEPVNSNEPILSQEATDMDNEYSENTGPKILNVSQLQQLKSDIGAANFDRIAKLFIDETRTRTTQLAPLLNSEDLETLAAAAHRLASSCLAFGLERFGNELRAAEHAAKDETAPELSPETLEFLSTESLKELQEYIAKQNDTN